MELLLIKLIEGFTGYGVSEDGKVWSNRRGRGWLEIKSHLAKNGYRVICLTLPGVKGAKRVVFNALVHRLVAAAFIGSSPFDKAEVDHLDNNRSNNCTENLEWVTKSENMRRVSQRDGNNIGSRNPGAKLQESDVLEIRRLKASGIRAEELAEQFGTSKRNIHRLCSGERWSHFVPEGTAGLKKQGYRGRPKPRESL